MSRSSAAGVALALAGRGHQAVRLELDGYLAESLRTGAYDVVFPVVHGAVGEDGSLQGLLEVLELPYVGSGVLASAMAMNKAVARRVFAAEGLPLARGFSARRTSSRSAREIAARALSEVEGGMVVKPAESGSAIGIGRFEARPPAAELEAAIESAFQLGNEVVIERFIRGKEVTCGVLETAGVAKALPPVEVRSPKDAFYTFDARYAPGRSEHICPAELEGRRDAVEAIALAAHLALGCRDLSRADFVVGDDEIVLLEVNTLPGMTATSLFPDEAAAVGMTYPELCEHLVRAADARGAPRRNAARAFPKP